LIPRKLVELAFRRLPLLALPMVLAPALVIAALSGVPDKYRSSATVWVSEAAGLGALPLGGDSRFASPAQRQAQVLNDLMRTERFRADVATDAGLLEDVVRADGADGVTVLSAAEVRHAATLVGRSVSVHAIGVNVLQISATHRDPLVAQSMAGAVIGQYQERVTSEVARQTTLAIEYFSEQLEIAQVELQVREDALTAHIEEHPQVVVPGSGDVVYESLVARVGTQGKVVDDLQQSVQSWYLSAASASQGQAARFDVQDQPSAETDPLPVAFTRRIGYPIASLGLGGMLALGYLYTTFRTDHSIRSSEDLEGLGVPILGYVPQVTSRQHAPWFRRLWRAERDFARRLAASLATPSGSGSAR
jgi:hypothetical protein